MNYTLTTTMEQWVYLFLEEQAKITKKTKKSIIEDALRLYQKHQLKAQIEAWLKERCEEYKTINNEFSDIQFNSIKI